MADTSEEDDFLVHLYDPTPVFTTEELRAQQAHDDAHAAAEAAIRMRKIAYQRLFVMGIGTPDDVQTVMLDLGRFCRGFESTFGEDERTQSRLDGRREVFLRVLDFTRLDFDELMIKYHRSQP